MRPQKSEEKDPLDALVLVPPDDWEALCKGGKRPHKAGSSGSAFPAQASSSGAGGGASGSKGDGSAFAGGASQQQQQQSQAPPPDAAGARQRIKAAAQALDAKVASLEAAAAECAERVRKAKEEKEALEKRAEAVRLVAEACALVRDNKAPPGLTADTLKSRVADVLDSACEFATVDAFRALQIRIRDRVRSPFCA